MNTQVNWYAGTTLSAVSESGFVALEGPNDLLLDLWRELEDGANLQRLLQVLAGYYNNNVFHLPDFVAGVFSDGAVHLALRGSITAEVTQVNGFVRTVSALNPIAWEEVRLDDVAALVIQAHGAGTEALPLRSGVTRASMLHWQLREVNRLVGAVKSQAYSAYSSNSAASGVSAASAPATRSAQSVASAYSGYSAGSAASVYSPASVVPSAAEASAARSLLEDTPISEVSSQPVAGLLPSAPSPEADAAETSAAAPVSALSEPSPQLPSAPSPAAPSVELLSAPSPQLPAVPAPAPNPVAASASLAAELVPGQNPDLSIATASPAAPSPASFSPASFTPAAPSPAVQTPATEHFEAISSAPSPAPSGAHAARVAVDLPGQASASSAAAAAANAFAPTSLLDVPAGAGPVPAPAAPSPEIIEAAPSPEPVSAPAQPKVSRAAAALAAMLGGSSAAKNQAPAPVAPSAPVAPGASYRMDDAPATVPTEVVPAAPAVPSAPLAAPSAPAASFQEPAAYSAPAVPSAPASAGELVIADSRAARATAAPAAPAAPQSQQNPEDQYFGHLYGQTIGVDVENAAVRELRDDEASGLEFNFEQGEGLDFSRRKGEKAEPTGPIQGINEGNPFSSSPFGGDPATAGSDPVPNPRTQSAELPLEAQATQINPVGNAVPLPGVQAPTGALDVAPGTPWTHDGYTIAVPTGGVQAPPPPVADSANADSDGPEVLAINCVNGHPNPVHASSCRICGGALNGKIVHVKRPSLGTLVASTGGSVTLDADVIVGRLPKAAPGTAVHLMAVASPTKSISKSHCRINIDDWELNLEDLNSTNGTYLLREGQLPRRLGGGQRELLRYGDRIDLGDGVVLSVEP